MGVPFRDYPVTLQKKRDSHTLPSLPPLNSSLIPHSYIAAKVKGDSFYYLLDIKEGKFATDESEEQILRIFHGLRTHGRSGDDEGEDEGGSGAGGGRRKSSGRRWKGGWKGKA